MLWIVLNNSSSLGKTAGFSTIGKNARLPGFAGPVSSAALDKVQLHKRFMPLFLLYYKINHLSSTCNTR